DWLTALSGFDLATPRDVAPTPPGHKGAIKYGRVAGVARGTEWNTRLLDEAGNTAVQIAIPPGEPLHEGIPPISQKILMRPLDPSPEKRLRIPEPGKSFTYPLSTVVGGTFGTKQI